MTKEERRQIPRPAGSAEQRQASLWRQAPRKARLLQTLAGQGQEALSFTWRAIDRSQDAGGQRPRPGRVNRRTPSVDRTNEGRREEVSVGSKGRLSMDYARNARTGNASIAGTRRLARSADKVAAPHDAARRATASRDRSTRRVTRTVQESREVDLPSYLSLHIDIPRLPRRRLVGLATPPMRFMVCPLIP